MENSKEHSKRTDRILPVVDIAGIPFHADAELGEFREVGNPMNRIHVLEMMSFSDRHEFLFDTRTKKTYETERFDFKIPEEVKTIWLRPIAATDPQGMEILIEKGQYKWIEHYKTPLPQVDIAGTSFYIDPIRKGFRQVDNRWNIILFSDTNFTEPRTVYIDKNVKNVPFPHELNIYDPPAKLPAHIELAQLPSANKMAELLRNVQTVNNKSHSQKEKKAIPLPGKSKRTRRKL